MYTFWDYKWKRWERDGGLRLDHILLSSALRERLRSGGVDRETRRMDGASDHAPVWVSLRDERRLPARLGPTGYRPESCAHDDGFAEEGAIDTSDGRRDSTERPRGEHSTSPRARIGRFW